MQPVTARFIPYAPRSGPENMAIDEYLVSWHGRTGVPVFRVYAWSPPAISLGRYQKIDCIDLEACRADGVGIVRRVTGGGAIYHDREITYSLACSGDDLDDKSLTIPESFEKVNRFLILFYRWLGFQAAYSGNAAETSPADRRAAFCFSGNEKYDILIGGKKIGGNAQRRMGKTMLQHGLIPLSVDRDRAARYFKKGIDGAGFTSLTELAGRDIEAAVKARLLAESFAEVTGLRLYNEDITPGEKTKIENIMNKKYLNNRWNLEGREDDNEVAAAGMA